MKREEVDVCQIPGRESRGKGLMFVEFRKLVKREEGVNVWGRASGKIRLY